MIKIQKAKPSEALEIKKLLRKTWNQAYKDILTSEQIENVTSEWHSQELLVKQIEAPDILFLVVKDGDKIVALCNTDEIKVDNHVNIQRLHVLPGYQRQGIGAQLIEEIIKRFPKIKKIDLEVEQQNLQAIAFYKKQGFKNVGKKDYNVANVTISCLIMEKTI